MRIVVIDLGTSSVKKENIDDKIIKNYYGGRGISTFLLSNHTGPGYDPLSPGSPFIISTGPLTGLPFPMGGRFIATAKSPLTNTIFTSSCGGRLGISLKKSSIDHLVIKGAAPQPSYILIENGAISIKSAGALWGKPKKSVTEQLKEKHGRDVSVLLIGIAGENGVLYANIENDGRFFGRGGLGALLGSKNIKAIVAKGRKRLIFPDAEAARFIMYECGKWLSANPITSRGLSRSGTGVFLDYMGDSGLITERNFRVHAAIDAKSLTGKKLAEYLLPRHSACPFCPIACGRLTTEGKGPEFETLWALGVNLSLYNPGDVIQLVDTCNELGMDTISAGVTVAMAIELSEKGLIPLNASYGNLSGIKNLLYCIATKEGAGDALSKGSKVLGDTYGAPDAAMHVKGLELPAYDPRGAFGQALGYVTSNRGGCHTQGHLISTETLGIPKLIDSHSVQGKASLLALYQDVLTFMDTFILCKHSSFAVPHDYLARIASIATGKKIDWEQTIEIGERIWNLERLFNLREGVEIDRLPDRFNNVPINMMLREYYAVRGWDSSGKPTQETLTRLGLSK